MGSTSATRKGEVINGAYELHELVSAQDSFEIYRATERATGRSVRVKLLRAEYALQGAVVETFLAAPRVCEKLEHASLQSSRIYTDDTGIPFVVEELVEGRALDELLGGFPQGLPLGLATHLLLPLMEVLALAHEQGVTHGALDTTHIRWLGTTTAPTPKLLDLGAAAIGGSKLDAAYRAPELLGPNDTSKAADVFAAGVLMFRMLSGELPFRRGDKRALPLDEVAPQLPAAWVELTAQCLELDPKRRPPHAGALLARMRARCSDRRSAPGVDRIDSRPAPKLSSRPAPARPVPERMEEQTKPDRPVSAAASIPVPVPERMSAEMPTVAAPKERTMSAVAAAFGALSDEESTRVTEAAKPEPKPEPQPSTSNKKDRKSSAKETAEKLKAKSKARNGDPRDASAEPTKPVAERKTPVTAAIPLAASKPVRPSGNQARPSQGQIAAAALTDAQLNALRSMRHDEEDDKDRWLGFFLMLFFMLLLQLGVPLLYEPGMASAQAMFGEKLRLAAAGFSVIVVIATARIWAAQVSASSVVMRITSFAMQLTAICICALTASLFAHGSGVASFAGVARRALPWGMSGLFFMFAFGGALRGARNMASNISYALLVMLLSTGSLYGSYRAIFSTVLAGTSAGQIAAARAVRAAAHKEAAHEEPSIGDSAQQLAKHGADVPDPNQWQDGQQQDVGHIAQRHEVGANEEDDLEATTEIGKAHERNKSTLDKLQQMGPTIAE